MIDKKLNEGIPVAESSRTSSLRNLMACLLLLVALGIMRWDNPTWIGSNIHPYFLLALTLAGISGIRSSIFPVVAMLSVYTLSYIETNSFAFYVTSLEGLGFTIGTFLSSMAIGFITDLVRKENQDLTNYLTTLKGTLFETEQNSEKLNRQIEDLTSKIAMERVPLTELISFSQQMDSEDLQTICEAMTKFLSKRLGVNSCYVYLIHEHELQRIAFMDDDSSALPVNISLQNVSEFPVVSSALLSKKCANYVDLALNQSLNEVKDVILMAAPIIDSGENVLGILAIRKLKFMQFLGSTASLIQTIGEYGGASISKFNRLKSLRERTFFNEELGVFNDRYFSMRLNQERVRSARYGQPLAVIEISFSALLSINHAKHSLVVKSIIKILNDFRRSEDVVAIVSGEDRFNLLLPMATQEVVTSLSYSILEQIKNVMAKTGLQNTLEFRLSSHWVIDTSSGIAKDMKVA